MAYEKLKKKSFNRTLRDADISLDKRKKVADIFDGKSKIKIREGSSEMSLGQKLKRGTDLSYSERKRIMRAHSGNSQNSSQVSSGTSKGSQYVNTSNSTSKPKTSFWQAINKGSKSQGSSSVSSNRFSNLRNKPGNPSFASSSGSNSRRPSFTSGFDRDLNRSASTTNMGENLSKSSTGSTRGSSTSTRPRNILRKP